jgi:outer membrane protein
VGFDLRFPIKNSAAKARNAQAKIALNKAQMEKQSIRQAIALEIRDALTQMEMNKARIKASNATVTAAEKRLEGEEARFEVGVGTTRELIEAQRDLLQAISTQTEARTALAISQAMLDKAVGRTFSRHGVVLKDEIKRNVE